LPVALLDVSVTLPPAQNVVGPLGVIVGVAGIALTVTLVADDAALLQPLVVTMTV
jgi:xanthosine utilization system XapX-like protein